MAARVLASDLTIPNIFGLLIRSRLVGVEQARALMERWEKESAGKTVKLGNIILNLINKSPLLLFDTIIPSLLIFLIILKSVAPEQLKCKFLPSICFNILSNPNKA